MFSRTATLSIATLTCLSATLAFADGHSAPPEVGARIGIMKNYSHNLGILGDMAKGKTDYNAEIAAVASGNLVTLTKINPSLLWPAGTDNGAIQGTRALPALWADGTVAQKAGADLAAAAEALAASSDLAGLQAAIGAAGNACSTCHKAYRAPK